MLIPNLHQSVYSSALEKLIAKIRNANGEMQESPYFLSDKTPVIRAIIPSNTLARYENDPAIYRIEETDFFSADASDSNLCVLDAVELDDVNLESLPIVTVLDSGIEFPSNMKSVIFKQWIAPNCTGGDSDHGTKVACRVAFKYIAQQIPSGKLTPRTRIIDCNILDGSVPVNIFIQRIQAAVAEFSDISKVYNLSANARSPIEGDEMSIVGYELDALQLRKKVQFIVSAGNHDMWKTESSLEDILDDDDSRISAPADSMLLIVVGAVVGADHEGSLSSKNEIAPYSRRGPGFKGLSKPDLSAYAATIVTTSGAPNVPADPFSLLLTKGGSLMPDAGTSFSAPTVTGDFAEILSITPGMDILLAKALIYHNAIPIWEDESMAEEELAYAHNLYCIRG